MKWTYWKDWHGWKLKNILSNSNFLNILAWFIILWSFVKLAQVCARVLILVISIITFFSPNNQLVSAYFLTNVQIANPSWFNLTLGWASVIILSIKIITLLFLHQLSITTKRCTNRCLPSAYPWRLNLALLIATVAWNKISIIAIFRMSKVSIRTIFRTKILS